RDSTARRGGPKSVESSGAFASGLATTSRSHRRHSFTVGLAVITPDSQWRENRPDIQARRYHDARSAPPNDPAPVTLWSAPLELPTWIPWPVSSPELSNSHGEGLPTSARVGAGAIALGRGDRRRSRNWNVAVDSHEQYRRGRSSQRDRAASAPGRHCRGCRQQCRILQSALLPAHRGERACDLVRAWHEGACI